MQDNKKETFYDIGKAKNFWLKSQKHKDFKAKTDNCDYIKLKIFCIVTETINRVKKQPTAWEKMLSNYTYKGLTSRM